MLRTLTATVLTLALLVSGAAFGQASGVEMIQPGDSAGSVQYVENGDRHMVLRIESTTMRVKVPDGWAVTPTLLILRGIAAPRIFNLTTGADAVIAMTPLPPGVTMDTLREQLNQQNADAAFRTLGSPIVAIEQAENLPEGVLLIGRDAGGRTTRQVFAVVGGFMVAEGNQGDRDGGSTDAQMRNAAVMAARSVSVLP